jgi:Na+/glutamate symporter
MPSEPLSPTVIAAIAATVGAGVAGIFGIVAQLIVQRGEIKRHKRKTTIDTALAYWQSELELAKYLGEKTGHEVEFASLDVFIIQMTMINDVLDSRPSTANLILELENIDIAIEDILRAKKRRHERETQGLG